ncbi:hypothetical protein SLS58_009996 [Diplodia intermedia]|uniref:Uncharacterized protein n=1 Tax=Diplodia intermedia TaxID=856260 RepID=A0ABR3T8S4_9PEZI
MPPITKKRPQGSLTRKGSSEFGAGAKSKEDDRATESQTFRRAAKTIDASSAEDSFFTQFKNGLDTDKRKLLSTVEKRQQDAIDEDAVFRRQLRTPIADALRPRITVTSAQGHPTQPTAGKAPEAAAASPAAAACPVAASGTQILQLSKQLLASYEEAAKAVDVGSDMLRDDGGRLGDGWPKDVEKLRGLLEIGYRKAQDDVVRVLQGSDGDGGSEDRDSGGVGRNKKDAQELAAKEGPRADVFFGADRDKREERERFNVTQSLCEASRGVLRLSRSLPSELLE